jgi:hypothetical protein
MTDLKPAAFMSYVHADDSKPNVKRARNLE